MENKTGFKPVGRSVLTKPYDPELNRTVIAVPDHVKQLELMREMRVQVIEIGPHCWVDEPPRAAVGDRVLVSKFTGVIVKSPLDGEFYRLVNDEDIFCQITSDLWDHIIPENPIAKSKQVERTTSSAVLSVPRR